MDKQVKASNNQYVVFKLGEEYYGIDIFKVKTIEKVSQYTRVPNSVNYILGVINLRGEVVPVMDIRKRLGLNAKETTSNSRIIIVNNEDITIGLLVDSSSEVVQLNDDEMDTPPAIGDSISSKYVEAIGKKNDRMIILLNFENILGVN